EIAGLLDHRARGGAEADAHLARHDLGERRLAQPGRAVEQHMVERLAARLGGGDEDLEVLAHLLLADEVVERLRTQRELRRILLGALPGHQAFRRGVHRANSCRPARITASSGAAAPRRWLT